MFYQTTKTEREIFKKHPEGKRHYKQENSKGIMTDFCQKPTEDNWIASLKC